jgi:hypothetical protein
MHQIEIDEKVMSLLQKHAEPFIDTPNTVLRRLLFPPDSELEPSSTTPRSPTPKSNAMPAPSSDSFVNTVLSERFDGPFETVGRFRMMFDSDTQRVYFQNFNQPSGNNLWYRLSPSALSKLQEHGRAQFVCLTNPAERFAYVLPFEEIQKRLKQQSWDRDSLEVNIDPSTSRWRELSWNLDPYREIF